ncbi:hypothetical protein PspLS_04039 [Pyricularia sp. CBS 133598]|nr:hypothetical protein PspLS_04039 [Pyricularia sp. CBS 133598]
MRRVGGCGPAVVRMGEAGLEVVGGWMGWRMGRIGGRVCGFPRGWGGCWCRGSERFGCGRDSVPTYAVVSKSKDIIRAVEVYTSKQS